MEKNIYIIFYSLVVLYAAFIWIGDEAYTIENLIAGVVIFILMLTISYFQVKISEWWNKKNE